MRNGGKRTALAICALALTLSLPGAAVAATSPVGNVKIAKFKIEVKGWQKMVQQNHHLATDECDLDNFSSGSELLAFRTPKPIVVSAYRSPGMFNPEFFEGRRLSIPTKATVKRSYTSRIGTLQNEDCAVAFGEGKGGLSPDCGTRVVRPYGLDLKYSERRRDRMLLANYTGEDPFERCPGASTASFPYLVEKKTGGGEITAQLSQNDLFNPGFRKWISIADGTYKVRSGDWWAKTRLHWEVSFTRLKGRGIGRP